MLLGKTLAVLQVALTIDGFFIQPLKASAALKASGGCPAAHLENPICFVAGTTVLTPDGEKPIEELRVGEFVVAGDPVTGTTESCQIKQEFKREVTLVLDIQVGDVTITCTPEHPFWIPGQGWQKAADLRPGTAFLTSENIYVTIDSINARQGAFTVYNIEVEKLHTYFVSSLRILVHNECNPSPALEGDQYHPTAVEQRIRPPYRPNPAHNLKSPLYNPRKTPEPSDAAQVYKDAVRGDMGTWYGVGKNGDIYRFFGDNAGGVHFSGTVPSQKVPNIVRKQLGV